MHALESVSQYLGHIVGKTRNLYWEISEARSCVTSEQNCRQGAGGKHIENDGGCLVGHSWLEDHPLNLTRTFGSIHFEAR